MTEEKLRPKIVEETKEYIKQNFDFSTRKDTIKLDVMQSQINFMNEQITNIDEVIDELKEFGFTKEEIKKIFLARLVRLEII